MSWFWPRLIAAWLCVFAGGLSGWAAAMLLHMPVRGSVLAGAAAAGSLMVVADMLAAHRLLRWLRRSLDGPAPRNRHFWGEVGLRVERSLRAREQALEQERQRLEQFLSAIEASPNGVLLLDARNQIEWCNSVAAGQLGLDPVRDRQQPVTHLVRAPAFVGHLQAGRFGETMTIPSPRGGTLSVLIRPYGEGQKLVLTQDITERERHDAMRRDFVANVSHEIRTPLTVLAGFVQTMGDLPLSEAERQRVLGLMRQQTDRMQSLVGDLLTLAQLEGSPRPAPDHWVLLRPTMLRVEADAQSLSQGRHQLRVRADGVEVALAGNEGELFSAIANLAHNALRYTPEGGRIDILWRDRPDGGGEIEVRDTGIGIAKEHLPRVTERFYRVDGSRSRDSGGTGLGLAIVKHVVQRHGGELDMQSEPGKGSSFRLVFPAARVRRQAAP